MTATTVCEERLQQTMKVSAPGKIIFVGEHSVVYGKQAIAFSLGLRTELVFKPAKNSVSLHLPEIQVEESWSIENLLQLWEKLKRIRRKSSTRGQQNELSTKDQQNKSSTQEKQKESSDRDQHKKSSTREKQKESSDRDQYEKSSTREKQMESSTRDQQKKSSTQDHQKESFTEDQQKKSSTKNQQNESSTRDKQKESSTRDQQKKLSTQDHEKELSTRDQQNKSSNKDQQNDSLTRDQQKKSSIQDHQKQSSTRDHHKESSTRDQKKESSTHSYQKESSTGPFLKESSTQSYQKGSSIQDHQQQPFVEAMTVEEGEVLKGFLKIDKRGDIGKRELGLLAFFHLYSAILPYPVPFSISVQSQMPVGSGLGSSAAYAVCLVSILQWLSGAVNPTDLSDKKRRKPEALKSICDWSFCCEKILHGTPSGIDNSICTYGEAVAFKAGKIRLLKAPSPLRIMLVNTCVTRNTKELVARVRERREHMCAVVEPILDSMDALTASVLTILEEMRANSLSGDALKSKMERLRVLIEVNHGLLCALGVSHAKLERAVFVAKFHGLSAKLTGAGGGGFAFVLLSPDTPEAVVESCRKDLEKEGFEIWITALGSNGVYMSSL